MRNYKCILVAMDFHSKSDQALLEKARSLAAKGTKIILVHAIEELTGMVAATYAVAGVQDIEKQLLDEAGTRLLKLAKKAKLSEKNIVLKLGLARNIILDVAKKTKADLIVIGSHGRHGFRALLGSTASAVLNNAPCDVLAVRVKK